MREVFIVEISKGTFTTMNDDRIENLIQLLKSLSAYISVQTPKPQR